MCPKERVKSFPLNRVQLLELSQKSPRVIDDDEREAGTRFRTVIKEFVSPLSGQACHRSWMVYSQWRNRKTIRAYSRKFWKRISDPTYCNQPDWLTSLAVRSLHRRPKIHFVLPEGTFTNRNLTGKLHVRPHSNKMPRNRWDVLILPNKEKEVFFFHKKKRYSWTTGEGDHDLYEYITLHLPRT